MKSFFRRRLLTSTLFVSAIAAAAPSYAQVADPVEAAPDAQEESGEVTVTGSRISNPNLEQSSPVAVVGSDEIQLQQVISAEELLRDLPGSIPSIGSQVNNGSGGQAFLNLRGLGSNRNLVLLDGGRLVPATLAAQVDTNIIPLALIERVDIFTGGASTVYGADAVAGVVNFVTKKDFAGIDLALQSGITERGDGALFKIDLTTGANLGDGRGNVTLSMGYTETDPIYQGNRDFSRVAIGSNNGLPQGSTTSVPITFRAPLVGQLNTATGALQTADPAGYNFAPLNLFQTPIRRFNILGKANYKISDAVEVYSSAFFVKSKVDFLAAPAGIFANPLLLPLSNPYLPATLRNALCAADSNASLAGVQPFRTQAQCDAGAAATSTASPDYFELPITSERRFVEAGPRVTEFTTTSFQFNLGLRGALTSSLNWDVNAAYGESERVTESLGAGFDPLQQGLRAFNTTTCTVTTGGCVPLNIFGPVGSLTPAQVNFLSLTTFAFVKTSYAEARAGISGDFGVASPLATNPIGIAIGGEYRKYKGESFGDAISRRPGAVLGAGAAALPIAGQYDSYEAYGEIIAPLIEDRPFFHSLTLEAGIRYSDSSTSGGNTTWKAGGSWEPFQGLKLRGMYTRAVRAPNLGELFQPQVVALSNLTTDPCQGSITTGAANFNSTLAGSAALQALCVATGVPAGAIGTGSIPSPSAGQIQTTQGGNPNLDPEKATTLTLGAVFQPTFLRNFSLSVDYYDIKVTDAISSPTVLDVIQGCYSPAFNPTFSRAVAACDGVGRNAVGRLDGAAVDTPGVFLASSNQGVIKTSGIDATLNWRTTFGQVGFNYSINGNYTFESKFQATPVSFDRECVGYYSTSCSPIQPEYTINQRTTFSVGDFDLSVLWRHIAPAVVEPPAPGGTQIVLFPAYARIKAYNYFDLALRAKASDQMTFTFTVTNLFDKDPPFVGQGIGATAFNGGNTFPSNYDPLGRRFVAGANLRF